MVKGLDATQNTRIQELLGVHTPKSYVNAASTGAVQHLKDAVHVCEGQKPDMARRVELHETLFLYIDDILQREKEVQGMERIALCRDAVRSLLTAMR